MTTAEELLIEQFGPVVPVWEAETRPVRGVPRQRRSRSDGEVLAGLRRAQSAGDRAGRAA